MFKNSKFSIYEMNQYTLVLTLGDILSPYEPGINGSVSGLFRGMPFFFLDVIVQKTFTQSSNLCGYQVLSYSTIPCFRTFTT